MKKLGGTVFCYNAISQDYHIEETVAALNEVCDEVIVLDAGSTDGSDKLVESLQNKKTKAILCPHKMWVEQKSQRKLSFFTNLCINALTSEWNLNIQADECPHEDSFQYIWDAVHDNSAEGYFCKRINLWGNSQYYLDVDDSRKPVGTEIIRLCKTIYQSVDDAQSIGCPASLSHLDKIRIYHTGFIRDSHKHIEKINHMMGEIFGWGVDDKIKSMGDSFDPFVHFNREDIRPIEEDLPKFIKKWCEIRDKTNGIII